VSNKPPYRADHVGSLLRPATLLEARRKHAAGEIDDDALRGVEDDSIRTVVSKQEEVGLRTATDGEFRRGTWHMDFFFALQGTAATEEAYSAEWHSGEGTTTSWHAGGLGVVDRLALRETIFGDAFRFLSGCVESATAKLTIPSPNVFGRIVERSISPDAYPDKGAFWDDVGNVYADEVARLGELGCEYLQIDDTSFAHITDANVQARMAESGTDPAREVEAYVSRFNRAVASAPDGMTITTHMCHGNFRSMWITQGSYEFVAEPLFNGLDVDGFFLEFDDERSGGFEPLRFVPNGKRVVLGLITTKRPELESADALKRRVEEASRFIDVDQLCISPQCGFASGEEGNLLTEEDQFAKLKLAVDTAHDIWGEL
jgi:5-methyltetrahydropteroyltriglutamate--homocysteine methyltransferase